MSVSTEVQRTLVKSPPELWAELGNQEGLARHLSEIGEIRVTKVEPESRVEWEADQASGIVQLKQSGWGTKVTLSLTRELPEAEGADEPAPDAVAEPEATAGPKAAAEPEAAVPEPTAESDADSPPEPEPADEPATEPEPEPAAVEPQPESEPAIDAPPEPTAVEPEPEPASEPVASEPAPKQGFFARLFKRRKPTVREPAPDPVAQVSPEPQPEPEPAVERQALALPEPSVERQALALPEPAVEPRALALPEPVYPDPPPELVEPEPSADLAAELAELEAQMQQESARLLTGVLDRLGAAHHRPFSRA
jgi:hypothetical protein